MIDTLVQIMGLPSNVYARIAGVSRPGTRFPYDTEDTAALLCQFAGGGIASLFGTTPLQMSGAAGHGFGPSLVQSGINSVAIGGQGYGGGAVGGSGSVANAGATGAPAGIYLELRGN